MDFIDCLNKATNITSTENGAKAYSTTGHACLDFFAMGAAKRNDPTGAVRLFSYAYAEDPQTAIRILFYIRDVRGGQGERKIFRQCLTWLDVHHPKTLAKVVDFIFEYGRWDDLIEAVPPIVSGRIIRRQLDIDAKAEHPSLLAKWMPSTWEEGEEIATAIGCRSERTYRKKLSKIRKKLNLLETKMSENRWAEIEYSKIPGQAFHKHTKAFDRHDHERFDAFLHKAKKSGEKGEKIINTKTLYPYEIYDMVRHRDFLAADAAWANLPDYPLQNAIVMADVSGSMHGLPMSISVSMALYYAEHNKGTFHNKFMTFSSHPKLVSARGDSLHEKMANIERADWGTSTNITAALDAVYSAALDSDPDEVPKTIIIISDMEFDNCATYGLTPLEEQRQKWEWAHLTMPKVVFWNVNSRQNQVPCVNEKGVTLVSGASLSTFEFITKGKNPLDLMMKVVNSPRYSQIVL